MTKSLTIGLVAGADQKFYPAKANIQGDSIILTSPQVKQPVAVRYAFQKSNQRSELTIKRELSLKK